MKCRKKYKRILALDIALLALFLFAGCQLAKEEGGETESAERDRLIGVFLTFFRKSGLWPLGTAAYLTVRLLMLARRTDAVQ